jgi:hypothetical protein
VALAAAVNPRVTNTPQIESSEVRLIGAEYHVPVLAMLIISGPEIEFLIRCTEINEPII